MAREISWGWVVRKGNRAKASTRSLLAGGLMHTLAGCFNKTASFADLFLRVLICKNGPPIQRTASGIKRHYAW